MAAKKLPKPTTALKKSRSELLRILTKRVAFLKSQEALVKAASKREEHDLLRLLFKDSKNPAILFKTHDGKRIKIARHGFYDVFREEAGIPRAFVIALVDGKKLFFYRSSGQHFKEMNWQWFPVAGVEHFTHAPSGRVVLTWLNKIAGHPSVKENRPTPGYPAWLNEVREKIRENEDKLVLHKDWGADKYLEVTRALEHIPLTHHVKLK